jgi:hypothetical protein
MLGFSFTGVKLKRGTLCTILQHPTVLWQNSTINLFGNFFQNSWNNDFSWVYSRSKLFLVNKTK